MAFQAGLRSAADYLRHTITLAIVAYCCTVALSPSANELLGLPQPTVDLSLSHERYADDNGYKDAGHGPYTHYVDNSAANCDDRGPGTDSRPLCRLPLDVPAGSVVEVHGGPYTNAEYALRGRTLRLRGSSAKPVFLRGVASGGSAVVFKDTWLELSGEHFVVESLELRGTPLVIGESSTTRHVIARDVEVTGNYERNAVKLDGEDMVLTSSHIHHNYGDDLHGVFVARGSRRIWVVGNELNHNSGDGIQFCHRCTDDPPRYVYIGGNDIYSNRENGVDIKFARNVIIAANRIYRHRVAEKNKQWCFDDGSFCGVFSSGSDGSSIVIGSDGGPVDVGVVYNEILDSRNGIRLEEGQEVLISSNYIHDLENTGLIIEKSGAAVNFVHNTLLRMNSGIRQKKNTDWDLNVSNNLFVGINESLVFRESSDALLVKLDNNLFWNDDNAIKMVWSGNRSLRRSEEVDSLEGTVKSGNLIADPKLGAGESLPWSPGAAGAAIDAANTDLLALAPGFAGRFPSTPSILADFSGTTRQGCEPDIGALESVCRSGGGTTADDPGPVDSPPDSGPDDPPGDTDPADPDPDPGGGGGTTPEEPASGSGGVLNARAERRYDPTTAVDFIKDFSTPQTVYVPGFLPVTSGQPSSKWAYVDLLLPDDRQICYYQGNGNRKKTKAPCGFRFNGDAYEFQFCVTEEAFESSSCAKKPSGKKCRRSATTLSPYEAVQIDGLRVVILDGDSCGPTEVDVEF